MINKKLTFNINKSLWLFALSFLISMVGLQAQNNIISLPPNYYQFPNTSPTSLPTPAFGYNGLPADYSSNAMQDASGNLLFFVVDDVVYDKDGNLIGYLQGNQGTELMIVPDPGNCDIYYIFYAIEGISHSPGDASSEPYFAILDISVGSLSNHKFKCDYSTLPCQLSIAPVKQQIAGGEWGGMINNNGLLTFATSPLNTNNERFIYTLMNGKILILKLDANGLSYVDHVVPFPNSFTAIRGEMEIVTLANGNYRLATTFSTKPVLVTNYGFIYVDLSPTTGLPLSSFGSYFYNDTQLFTKGLELSPDGEYIYITHNSTTTTPSVIDEYQVGVSSSPTAVSGIPSLQAADFENSQIELGSDGKLYFATNDRLATYNLTTSTWNNSQLSITYTSNLGAGTLSSIYEAYLLPDQIDGMDYTAHFTASTECCITYTSFDVEADKNNQEYTGTATWSSGSNPFGSASGTVTVRDLLVIKSGANITINNMRFEFAVGARLIVENGARLTINGTTLTVYDDCGGNNLMWQGVEVWGIGTGTFQPAVSGRFIAQNNSVIEHAIEGAVNFKHATSANNGGIIQANTGTTFRNNYRDVVFNPFQSVFGSSQLNDQSYFSDVTFITDASLNNPSLNNSIIHAILNEVTGVGFQGCDFENTDITGTVYPYLGRGQGISAFGSKFTVNARCATTTFPCTTYDESNFINLTSGILAWSAVKSQTVTVNKSNFNNIFQTIFTYNIDNAIFTENDFDIGASPSGNFSYGLYMLGCSGYTVENNYFTTTHNGYVGVYINSSGTAANEVYRNNFSNLVVGSQAAGTNGDGLAGGDGLEFRCNTYEDIADYDILVSSGMVADDHGNCYTVTGPSNNQFSYTVQYGDFWLDNSISQPHAYSYSPNGSNLEPRSSYYNLNTATHECVNLPDFNYNNSCPNRLGGGGIMMMSMELSTQEAQYDSINNLMSTKDTSLLKILEQDLAVVKSQMQRTRSYIMQELLLGNENSDGKIEAINFLQQHAAYNTNADEQALAQLYISTGNIGAAQSKIAQLQSNPNNQQFAEFSNIAITLKQHPKQNKALLKDSVLLQQVKDLAAETEVCNGVASARALLVSLGLATYEETIEVVIPTSSKARLANEENETNATNKDSFVNVFPNPANDNLTISHNLETKNGIISLEIMDVMGRVLINKTINNTNNQIDINQLSSGLYFYNVLQNDKMVQSGKLVVE
ncbi:MAG: T9SS type A sorting domain-containing protein [Vicingaceae bacterium]|nr:T9SS type A sorting domain-containing protein [Vicingaceae bacterium]